jgi:hypothetical protein
MDPGRAGRTRRHPAPSHRTWWPASLCGGARTLRYDAAARPLAQATTDAGHHVIAAAVRRTFVMGETGTGSA